LEEKVFYRFILKAEMASGTSNPMSFKQIIFGEDSIILNQPHKNLYLIWDFGFPNMLKPIS